MYTRNLRRPMAVLLCVLVVSFAFLSMVLAASHAMHDCMDEQCTICAMIHGAQSLLRQLFLVALHSLLALIALVGGMFAAGCATHRRKANTPIALKVRLNP